MYNPRFTYTSEIVSFLNQIEFIRGAINAKVIPLHASENLRYRAKIKSSYYSTVIEGNPLTIQQAEEAIKKRTGATVSQHEQEVRNYWRALTFLNKSRALRINVTEEFIKRLHKIIEVRGPGRRGKQSEYRGEMPPGYLFCVRDSVTGDIDYIPPAYEDVPGLMKDLVDWITTPQNMSAPVKAALTAFQLLTIHPFSDGNGRLARALALYLLMLDGYDLNGYFTVEEYYVKDLDNYYKNLQMGLPPNYYDGRNNPDITSWITYFLKIMSEAYVGIYSSAERLHDASEGKLLELSKREIKLLQLAIRFEGRPLSLEMMAEWFEVSKRTMQEWVKDWVAIQLLEPASGVKRVTSYQLGGNYRDLKLEDIN